MDCANPQNTVTPTLRIVANNLDAIADHEAVRGYEKLVHILRNNAAYVRKVAIKYLNLETQMGQYADKIHAVEKQRDAARADAAAQKTRADQNQQSTDTLAALTAAGKIADDADVAALTDDTGETPTPVEPAPTPEPTPAP